MAEYIAYKHYTSIYPSLYSPVEGCLSDQSQLATTSEWPVFTFVHCHIASKRPKPRLISIQKRQTDYTWEDFLSQSSSRVLSLVAISNSTSSLCLWLLFATVRLGCKIIFGKFDLTEESLKRSPFEDKWKWFTPNKWPSYGWSSAWQRLWPGNKTCWTWPTTISRPELEKRRQPSSCSTLHGENITELCYLLSRISLSSSPMGHIRISSVCYHLLIYTNNISQIVYYR